MKEKYMDSETDRHQQWYHSLYQKSQQKYTNK